MVYTCVIIRLDEGPRIGGAETREEAQRMFAEACAPGWDFKKSRSAIARHSQAQAHAGSRLCADFYERRSESASLMPTTTKSAPMPRSSHVCHWK
jgi:hypothetical protein